MLVAIVVGARSLRAFMAASKVPLPRIASQVSLLAPSMLTWIFTRRVAASLAISSALSNVPLVEMQVMIPLL